MRKFKSPKFWEHIPKHHSGPMYGYDVGDVVILQIPIKLTHYKAGIGYEYVCKSLKALTPIILVDFAPKVLETGDRVKWHPEKYDHKEYFYNAIELFPEPFNCGNEHESHIIQRIREHFVTIRHPTEREIQHLMALLMKEQEGEIDVALEKFKSKGLRFDPNLFVRKKNEKDIPE